MLTFVFLFVSSQHLFIHLFIYFLVFIYFCLSATSIHFGNATNDTILSLEPPIFSSKPPSLVYAARGSSLSLCCEAVGTPLPKVEWLRPKKSSDSLLTVQGKGCLKVNTIKYNSEGEYICRATNHFGRAETTTAVIIGCLFCYCSVFYFSMFS